MNRLDFDSAIPRFDPWRPSQCFPQFLGLDARGHSGHGGTDGTLLPHETRHTLDAFTARGTIESQSCSLGVPVMTEADHADQAAVEFIKAVM